MEIVTNKVSFTPKFANFLETNHYGRKESPNYSFVLWLIAESNYVEKDACNLQFLLG